MKVGHVLVKFTASSKDYAYFTDLDLEPGDSVVVEAGELVVVKVSKTKDLTLAEKSSATKWVIQRVDLTEYNARKAETIFPKEKSDTTKIMEGILND